MVVQREERKRVRVRRKKELEDTEKGGGDFGGLEKMDVGIIERVIKKVQKISNNGEGRG